MESPFLSHLARIHQELSPVVDGEPYRGIPTLADADPDAFGICLTTAGGHTYAVGDTDEAFTIQSTSKPFTYGLALTDLGEEAVDAKINVEPSGDAFNEISLARGTGRPANAMINAGALAATSLVGSTGGRSRFQRILGTYSALAGRQLAVSEQSFDAESRTGFRNHALAYLLRSFEIFEEHPTTVVTDYFHQCSVLVTCQDLSMMAATLANGGRNPGTGEQVFDIGVVERVLSVMATCGMYDDAGWWMTTVGMPAKSGVGGGILAVLPGQAGLAVYSPRLGAHGTSVRGAAACRRLAQDMELHFVRAAPTGRSVIRASCDLTEAGTRQRDGTDAQLIAVHGRRGRIVELHGDVLFAGAESVVRELSELGDRVEVVVLDLTHVHRLAPVGVRLLTEIRGTWSAAGRELAIVDDDGDLAADFRVLDPEIPAFGTRDTAVEWAQEHLIAAHGH